MCLLARWRLAFSAAAAVDFGLIDATLELVPRRDVQRYGQSRGGELIPLRARRLASMLESRPCFVERGPNPRTRVEQVQQALGFESSVYHLRLGPERSLFVGLPVALRQVSVSAEEGLRVLFAVQAPVLLILREQVLIAEAARCSLLSRRALCGSD